jgi:DNA-binding NarL/FixJ family response regulator
VLKQIDSADLVRALERVGNGESMLDPAVTQKVFARVRQQARHADDAAFGALNDQELQILALITEGMTNKEIAGRVFLSEKTVRNYVSAILAKLDLSSRAEAAAYAVRHHIQDHMPEPRETRDERR